MTSIVDISLPGKAAWGVTTRLSVDALRGTTDWGSILIEGDAPNAGEVVLRQEIAESLAVEIGDTVALTSPETLVSNRSESWDFTLSGISRGNAKSVIETRVTDGYTA